MVGDGNPVVGEAVIFLQKVFFWAALVITPRSPDLLMPVCHS